jgi:hypothetical protein
MTNETQEPVAPTSTATRHWLPWAIASLAIVVAVVIGAAFAATAGDDDDDIGASSSPYVMMMQGDDARHACTQWRERAGDAAPPAETCNAMAEWMRSTMGGGRMQGDARMQGSMMAGDVDGMIDACEQWMATTPTSTESTTSTAWCTQMAEWMNSTGTR